MQQNKKLPLYCINLPSQIGPTSHSKQEYPELFNSPGKIQKKMSWIDQDASDDHEKYWVNIRGKMGFLRKSLIDQVPESSLAQLFTGKIKCQMVEGTPFLDKDPETFKNVVIYLANGMNLPKLDK